MKQSNILAEMENIYGGYKCPDLKKQIEFSKGQIATYYGLLREINAEMKDDIVAAVHETLRQSLPRRGDADPDDDILKDYYWFHAGGSSIEPREYSVADEAAGDGEEKSVASYFSGLRNTEQDEMVFLNMADGLPGDAGVTLADYFGDERFDSIGGNGLDQWFIRCRPEESKFDGTGSTDGAETVGSNCGGAKGVCVERDWVSPTPGIVRCYKNANYHDARSKYLPPDVHRGNYCFDGLSGLDSVASAFGKCVGAAVSKIPVVGGYVSNAISGLATDLFNNLLSNISFVASDIIEPSCYNERASFPDTCAAIDDSWGLVAEYEWAAAYWICWYRKEGLWPAGSVYECGHVPLPIGAAYGGATDNGYDSRGGLIPGRWVPEAMKNFMGNPRGHARGGYRTECMSIDGEKWDVQECGSEDVTNDNGHGANVGIKSYVRVYGDDKDAYDECYYGQYAMPWLLNENFFNGGGTIIVGLARKRRNVFDLIVGGNVPENSLHAAFSPPDGSHVVALSAARAAYAPRIGDHTASGDDTTNVGGGVRYDIHYDAVCKDLKPKLMRGANPKQEWVAQAAKLESAPFWIGCVCTDSRGDSPSSTKMAQTANRLRRQWNLCQTDWDGVLLPLRFSMSAIREFNSNEPGNGRVKAIADESPEWGPFASDYGEDDAVFNLAQILTPMEMAGEDAAKLWHSFDEQNRASLPELLEQGTPSTTSQFSTQEFTEAMRKRRVL